MPFRRCRTCSLTTQESVDVRPTRTRATTHRTGLGTCHRRSALPRSEALRGHAHAAARGTASLTECQPHTASVSSESDGDASAVVAWKRLSRDRPWYRKFASQPLAEAEVESDDGRTYLVRVRKNLPLIGPQGVDASDPLSTVFGVVKANVEAGGETGWRIDVVSPGSGWRRETVLYTQHVGARAIVVDVIMAITNALERGDQLWPDDDE